MGCWGTPIMAPSDPMRIMCPNLTCRKILAVPQSARGKTVRCRGCGTNIRVPATPGPKDTAPPPQPDKAGTTPAKS